MPSRINDHFLGGRKIKRNKSLLLYRKMLCFSGDFTLDINPVLLEDDAVFECQVGAAEGVNAIRSGNAALTVRVPPESPVVQLVRPASQGAVSGSSGLLTVSTTEDRQVVLECVSRGGKPAAEVSE